MTQPMTASKERHAATAFAQAGAQEQAAPQTQRVEMGHFYIKNAVPMKGAKPNAEGKCMFVLECFPVDADATPGQIANRVYKPQEAQYIVYHGFMSRHKGDAGMIVGYVYECAGRKGFTNATGTQAMRGTIMTEAGFAATRRPQVEYDRDYPRFGEAAPFIQSAAEEIATLDAIDSIRSPKEAPRRRPNIA